tara:strand:- start:228 stop:557 length:330 start_codon:yes stop_codon:yes gene_type:complete
MENSIGIIIGIVVVGFIAYKIFYKGEKVVDVPAKAPAPAPAPVEVKKAPTKAQLSKLTKKQIDDLAKLEWGIKLDARKSKDDMIKEFIKLAKAQIKNDEAGGDDDEDEV